MDDRLVCSTKKRTTTALLVEGYCGHIVPQGKQHGQNVEDDGDEVENEDDEY